jgi:class 3 adenylate cyclase
VVFIPPIYYHLILGSIGNTFKGRESSMSSFFERLKQLSYVFSAGWFVLMVREMKPGEMISGARLSFPNMDQQFWIASLAYAALMGIATTLLIKQTRASSDPTQKSRLMYMLMGTTTILLSGFFSVFLTHALRLELEWLSPLGHVAATFCMAFIAYSLTTSHLYQFSELLRKMLAFMVMTVILIAVFGSTHFLSTKLLVPYIPRSDFFALGMSSITMALLFHPLRFRVQNLVDKIFFSQQYDQMQRLRGLSRRVLSSADRDELLNILFSSLKSIGFHSMSLLLKDPQKPIFHIRKSNGLSPNADGFFLKTDSLLIQHVREEKGELIRDEVTRRILTDWERQALTDEMDVLQSEICFPLFSTRRRALFGVITLGNSDLGYSSYKGRNIFWLKSVIDNAGIMLDNFYHQEFANALVPYVGRAWANEMRRNKEGFRERLAGYRTWVAVLMVDIRHFTPLSARLDPRDVVDLLKDFRSRIAPIVYRHQGTIDKFIGDAVMIVFGLPILPHLANPDQNAVQCAFDIMKEMEVMNQKRFEAGKKEQIPIGIGVSSGEVIAGNVDSGDRVEYTVIGDSVNMVARLEDLAGDNQVLLSPATYHRVKEHVSVKAWKPRYLTGFDEPMIVYELLGLTNNGGESTGQTPAQDSSIGPLVVNE